MGCYLDVVFGCVMFCVKLCLYVYSLCFYFIVCVVSVFACNLVFAGFIEVGVVGVVVVDCYCV